MSDIVPIEPSTSRETTRDDLHLRNRYEVEEAARQWFAVATDMRDQRDTVAEDLEAALNIARSYQRVMTEFDIPDPNLVQLRNLLRKYRMPSPEPTHSRYRVFVDGIDITEHPDSVPGTEVEVLELTADEYYGTETAELVADDEGNMRLIAKHAEVIPEADTLADEPDPEEPIDPETRDWLNEEPHAQCDTCKRLTWDDEVVECKMPQPDGALCPGTFGAVTEKLVRDEDGEYVEHLSLALSPWAVSLNDLSPWIPTDEDIRAMDSMTDEGGPVGVDD